jgi:hypothetical protein
MLEKIKDIGTQVASRANDAIEGVSTTVKGGVESLAHTASEITDTLNEKTVRASTAQMCNILEIALDELKSRPLSERPVSLKTTVNIGLASLEMEIQVPPAAKGNV